MNMKMMIMKVTSVIRIIVTFIIIIIIISTML